MTKLNVPVGVLGAILAFAIRCPVPERHLQDAGNHVAGVHAVHARNSVAKPAVVQCDRSRGDCFRVADLHESAPLPYSAFHRVPDQVDRRHGEESP